MPTRSPTDTALTHDPTLTESAYTRQQVENTNLAQLRQLLRAQLQPAYERLESRLRGHADPCSW